MSRSDEKKGVDLDSILEKLGGRGRYQVIQLMLNVFPWFLGPSIVLDTVFVGYQPDYQCNQVDNISQMEAYLPDDVTNFTLHDIQYRQCSIDVTVNTSGTSTTHSLPCVAGVNFSMPSHTSFVTEWSLVCDKAGLTELTLTGVFGGKVAGIVTSSILADRFGRKKVYVTCALTAMVSAFAKALVPNYYFSLVCRICAGFFIQGMDQTGCTMFMELVAPEWRSLGSVVGAVLWAGGCVFMAIVAYCLQGVSWRYLSLAFYSVYVFGLLSPWFLDESLRWLLATGNIEEAERILKKTCRINGKDFENIKTLLKRPVSTDNNFDDRDQSDSSPPIIQITNSSVMRNDKNKEDTNGDELNDEETDDISAERRGSGSDQRDPEEGGPGNDSDEGSSLLMPETEVFSAKVMLNTYYYMVMLQSARLSGNRFLNFALLSIQDITSTLLTLFLMQRYGGGQGVTLTLATAAQYVGMFAVTGSYTLLFVYYMEVFPTTLRATGTGAAGMAAFTANMGVPYLLLWT
ncbi:steroid transmembrane transporter SLC22A24-like [Babylonia areolata]|uniref:steroid transmembrane transporter SLC22A24-like n=1 Tax=Babylonia areolata TaxID=304850 RepID=UPI003FD11BE5